jgi:NAD+ synthase
MLILFAGQRRNCPNSLQTATAVVAFRSDKKMSNALAPDDQQSAIIADLDVQSSIDPAAEAERRINFLYQQLVKSGRAALVLGISGGIDSLTAGILSQKAVELARANGVRAQFIAMRLPYGTQKDESDAQRSLEAIKPDVILTVDVKPASDAMLASVKAAKVVFSDEYAEDFNLGNIKARQRMIAQYAVAGNADGLVVGTDHAAEAVTGFFTKYGDGGCDVAPLSGLTKRQVRSIAHHFGVDAVLVNKVPTADLETLAPMKPDEASLGLGYAEIDDYLEGKKIDKAAAERLANRYHLTAHKRSSPITPSDSSV